MNEETIKCIAVDDEPLALEQMARFVGRIPQLQLLATCLTAAAAREVIKRERVELVFLDIEMPGCNGVEFAKSLATPQGDSWNGAIIFTTAYPQYAVEGFRLDAVDYLLKPLSFEELQTAVEKVKRRLRSTPPSGQPTATAQTLFVKVNGTIRQIPLDDIVYVQGLSAYIQICVKGEPRLLTTHESLKHLASLLPAHRFVRIHKSYIINIGHLEGTDTTTATLNGKTLPIGEKYRADFKRLMKEKIAQ